MGSAWPFAHKMAEKKDGAVLLSAEGILSKSGNETRPITKKKGIQKYGAKNKLNKDQK